MDVGSDSANCSSPLGHQGFGRVLGTMSGPAGSQTLQLLSTTNKLLELNTQADGSNPELLKAIAELLRAIYRKIDGTGSPSPSRSPTKAGRSMGSSKGAGWGEGPQSGEIVEWTGHANVWLDRGCRVDQREALTRLYNRNRELLMVAL